MKPENETMWGSKKLFLIIIFVGLSLIAGLALLSFSTPPPVTSPEFSNTTGPKSKTPDRTVPQETNREPATVPASPSPLLVTPATDAGITWVEQSSIPHGPPGTVQVTESGQSVTVEWKGTRDHTIQGYQIYQKLTTEEVWKVIGFVELRADDSLNRGIYRFEKNIEPGFEYAVAAVGLDGKEGPKNVEIQ